MWPLVLGWAARNWRDIALAAMIVAITLGAYAYHRSVVAHAIAWERLKVDAEWRGKLAASEADLRKRLDAEAAAAYAKGVQEATARADAADAARIEAEHAAAEIARNSEAARTCVADPAIVGGLNRLR